ncbi:unnamed protein product [Gadus morhua 'NCC']
MLKTKSVKGPESLRTRISKAKVSKTETLKDPEPQIMRISKTETLKDQEFQRPRLTKTETLKDRDSQRPKVSDPESQRPGVLKARSLKGPESQRPRVSKAQSLQGPESQRQRLSKAQSLNDFLLSTLSLTELWPSVPVMSPLASFGGLCRIWPSSNSASTECLGGRIPFCHGYGTPG